MAFASLAPFAGEAPLDKQGYLSTTACDSGGVELIRTSDQQLEKLPGKLILATGALEAVVVGRHKACDAVLDVKAASKMHCQLALRSFSVPGNEDVNEALFLRDVSKNNTLVNGAPAFRPWHWLQDGDRIGLHPAADPSSVLDFFEVRYMALRKLPLSDVALEDLEATQGLPGTAAPGSAALPPPSAAAAAARRSRSPAKARRPVGRSRAGRTAPGRVPPRGKAGAVQLGDEAIGLMIDVTYKDPPATYRMKVVEYVFTEGFHWCDSEGFSTWDGESFRDLLDLNCKKSEYSVKFVDGLDDGETAVRPLQARKGGRRAKARK